MVEKLDGSLLIVSKYNGQYILRTRGTVDASIMANGHELEIFKNTILSKLADNNDTWDYSVLFEWLSPINKIVLNYGDEQTTNRMLKIYELFEVAGWKTKITDVNGQTFYKTAAGKAAGARV